MKNVGFLSAALIIGCHSLMVFSAGAQVRQSWVGRHSAGDTVRDTANSMAVDAAGNVYVAGNVPNTNTIYRFSEYQTMKFGSDGRLRWAVRYRGATNGHNYAAALRLDTAGNCYVTGTSQTNYPMSPTEIATVKYDPEGRQMWVARHGPRFENHPTALTLDNAGNAYVAGYANGGGYSTAKINTGGNVEWAREFIGPKGNGTGNAVAVDSAGNVFVTGWASAVTADIADMFTLKYGADGTLLWTRSFDTAGQPSWAEKGYALTTDAAGNVYVTGGGTTGFVTLKYSNNGGTLLWYSIMASQFSEWEAQHIALDSAGNVIVAGPVPSRTDAMEWGVAKYSPGGSNQWSRFAHLAAGYWYDFIAGMVVDADGAIYVTGSGGAESNAVYIVTRKYAPDGRELWKMVYKDPVLPTARACGLALDQYRNVIVAGIVSTAFDTNADVVVIKYEQAQIAARLRMVSFDPSAGARLSLFGQSNAMYTIEASVNLKDWGEIGTVPNPTGTVELSDPAVPGVSQRFYRARSP